MKRERHRLQFEALESRVMLSGVDVAVQPSALAATQSAIEANGAYVDVQLLPYEQILIVKGSGSGNVEIDLNQLPDSIVNLQISSFESVTLTGTHTVNALFLNAVKFVDAGQISIGQGGLFASSVAHVRMDAAPEAIYLWGAGGLGSVGEKTLLEVGRFSSAPTAGIWAWVENLGLATSSHVETVPQILGYPNQSILLNFQPDNPLRVTTEGAVNVIKGGDFVRYFLSSPSERAAQEQLHLVARQAADANVVSVESVLSTTSIRAALTDVSGNANAAMAAWTLGQNELLHGRSLILVSSRVVDGRLAAPESAITGATAGHTDLHPLLALDGRVDAGAPTDSSGRNDGAPVAAGAELVLPTQPVARAPNQQEPDAAQATLPMLGESFTHVVAELREQFASFGDLVTAQVADHLRSDRQLALLVDARAGRARDNFEVVDA